MRYANLYLRFFLSLIPVGLFLTYNNRVFAESAQEALTQALQDKPQEDPGMHFYPNCAALHEDLARSFEEMWLQDKASISSAIGMDRPVYGVDKEVENTQPSANDAGVEGATNVQERVVDEADRF